LELSIPGPVPKRSSRVPSKRDPHVATAGRRQGGTRIYCSGHPDTFYVQAARHHHGTVCSLYLLTTDSTGRTSVLVTRNGVMSCLPDMMFYHLSVACGVPAVAFSSVAFPSKAALCSFAAAALSACGRSALLRIPVGTTHIRLLLPRALRRSGMVRLFRRPMKGCFAFMTYMRLRVLKLDDA